MRTWQGTLKDLETMGVDWSDARDTTRVAMVPDGDNSSPDVSDVPLGTGGTKS